MKHDLRPTMGDRFYHLAGIGFLFLSKAKSAILGYSSPKPFPPQEYQRCLEYDLRIVSHWLSFLENYARQEDYLSGKNVLELGPGSDLGVGLCLLHRGAATYSAMDRNNLIRNTGQGFYDLLLARLKSLDEKAGIERLRAQLPPANGTGGNSLLKYVFRKDFDIAASFQEGFFDLIFAQAAFEHFDDIEATVKQLGTVAKSGAVLITEVDLATHSRWIRDRDPLNIYRYGDRIYRLFRFKGAPNRHRPYEYKALLEKHGWRDVTVTPLTVLDHKRYQRSSGSLNIKFRDEINQMSYLSIMLCARKA